MKIKRIVAKDMQQAMQQIRRELGDDAIIISTTKEPVRSIRHLLGKRRVEVTAAVDDMPLELPEPANIPAVTPLSLPAEATVRTGPMEGPGSSPEAAPERIIPGRIRPAKLPDPIVQIYGLEEKNWFRTILQQELDKGETGLENGVVGKWKKVFRQIEVNDTVSEIIFKDFAPSIEGAGLPSEDIFKVHLKEQIISLLKPAYEKKNVARIQTFIGPTGVGKTMTLVKLATRSKVVEKKQIAMIAVYNHRFGAMEKLNYFGNIIGASVDVVMTPAELARAVEGHRDKDVIFIDTEGRPSMNRSQVLELHTFIGAVHEPQNIHLVLSSPTKNRDLIRIANDFRSVGYNRIVLTKMDETDTYGTMLNLVCNTGVPISHVTNGQNVPDDIERLTPKRFAELILGSVVLDEDYQT